MEAAAKKTKEMRFVTQQKKNLVWADQKTYCESQTSKQQPITVGKIPKFRPEIQFLYSMADFSSSSLWSSRRKNLIKYDKTLKVKIIYNDLTSLEIFDKLLEWNIFFVHSGLSFKKSSQTNFRSKCLNSPGCGWDSTMAAA